MGASAPPGSGGARAEGPAPPTKRKPDAKAKAKAEVRGNPPLPEHVRLAPLPEADDEFAHLYYKNRDSNPPERIAEFKWRKEMERRQRRALGDGYGCLGDRLRGDPAFAAGCKLEGAIPDEFRPPPTEGRAAVFAARGRDPTGLSFLHSLDARPLTPGDTAG